MASVLLSPIGNGQQFFDNDGAPLNGGLIYTYQAGSSTLLSTYTTVNGTIANSNPIVLDAYGRTPSEVWLQQGYSYKFVIKTSAAVTLQTLDNIYGILQTAPSSAPTLPTGMILLWSGSLGSIPSGYVICDGTNGTPDLRDRFIVGAGSAYAVAATGGSADSIIVSHTHTVADHTHTGVTRVPQGTARYTLTPYSGVGTNATLGGGDTTSQTTDATGLTTNSTGTSGTNANLPPYYALAYIMKT